jgi:hypothetical protein
MRGSGDTFGTLNDPCYAASTGGRFRGCTHSLMFKLPCSLGLQAAPTAVIPHRAVRPFTPRIAPDGYPSQDVVSLRVRHEQLTRLDFHQLDCSLVGCSPHPCPWLLSPVPDVHRQFCESPATAMPSPPVPGVHRQLCESPASSMTPSLAPGVLWMMAVDLSKNSVRTLPSEGRE